MSRTFYEFNKAQIIERFGERGAPLGVVKQHIICDPRDKRRRLREMLGLQFRRDAVIGWNVAIPIEPTSEPAHPVPLDVVGEIFSRKPGRQLLRCKHSIEEAARPWML